MTGGGKPIFVATHPRACSTAFERVFMTQRDTLKCIHEPFGDAFYYGPERLGSRYENDEKSRQESGFSESTYRSVFDSIMKEAADGKRVFIKDITHYLLPPNQKSVSIAPSLQKSKRGIGTLSDNTFDESASESISPADSGVAVPQSPVQHPHAFSEPGNPSVVPLKILEQFHFAFLIRHPKYSIPSYYRCTIPPLEDITGFHDFMPEEAGYDEQRRLFDYLRSSKVIGPTVAGQRTGDSTHEPDSTNKGIEICVIDADDLLDDPTGILQKFCASVGIDFSPSMLNWDTEEEHDFAKGKFEKWRGFHEDAIHSTKLKPRAHKKQHKPVDELYNDWIEKFGRDGADLIRETVVKTTPDYEYMRQFAIQA